MSDMLSFTYAAESVVLRTERLVKQKGVEKCSHLMDMMRLFVYKAAD